MVLWQQRRLLGRKIEVSACRETVGRKKMATLEFTTTRIRCTWLTSLKEQLLSSLQRANAANDPSTSESLNSAECGLCHGLARWLI